MSVTFTVVHARKYRTN